MSDDYQRIELITGAVRRRLWTTEQKLQIIEESFQPGETVSSVARRRGVAPKSAVSLAPVDDRGRSCSGGIG
jgi:transposase